MCPVRISCTGRTDASRTDMLHRTNRCVRDGYLVPQEPMRPVRISCTARPDASRTDILHGTNRVVPCSIFYPGWYAAPHDPSRPDILHGTNQCVPYGYAAPDEPMRPVQIWHRTNRCVRYGYLVPHEPMRPVRISCTARTESSRIPAATRCRIRCNISVSGVLSPPQNPL